MTARERKSKGKRERKSKMSVGIFFLPFPEVSHPVEMLSRATHLKKQQRRRIKTGLRSQEVLAAVKVGLHCEAIHPFIQLTGPRDS